MATAQDSAAYWSRLEAPEHDEASFPRRSKRWTTRAALVASVVAAAVGAALFLTSARPSVDERADQTVYKQQGQVENPLVMTELLEITSIHDFNELLATSIVADSTKLYEAMPTNQLHALFTDFLQNIGSQIPNIDGPIQEGSRAYKSPDEHAFRFEVFQKNILSILQHNAEEYAINPDTKRARYGITVHADFTEDEFKTTRLNLLAVNHTTLFESAKNIPKFDEAEEESKKEEPMEDELEVSSTDPTNATALFSGSTICAKQTGGTCLFLRCDPSRGADCYEGRCICTGSGCAKEGKCSRPGCEIFTGGSCKFWFKCDASRNAQCQDHNCNCAEGFCAQGGRCVAEIHAPTPPPARRRRSKNRFGCVGVSSVTSTPVRQQGQCGDCWAFSTAQQLRYMAKKKFGRDPGTMSVQYMVDCVDLYASHSCSEGVKGCCGGLPYKADFWLEAHGGAPTQANYGPLLSDKHPHQAYTCKTPRAGTRIKPVSAWQYKTEEAIAMAYCQKGPVSIAIEANSALQHYTGGIMTAARCPAQGINHAVLYVGVDTNHDSGKPVHVLLNSWGGSWGVTPRPPYSHNYGDNGHFLFRFGENTCNIKALATSPADVKEV